MKKWILIIFVILLSGCGMLRNKSKSRLKEKVRLVDMSKVLEKSPREKTTIILPYPRKSPDRPRNEIKTFKGTLGSTVGVQFDNEGTVSRIDADCPEIDKFTQRNLELDYKITMLEKEKKFDIEIINVVGKWLAIILIPIGFFFAVAFRYKR